MKSILHTIEPRDAKSGLVNVIVDTPRGSRNEFRFDETLGWSQVVAHSSRRALLSLPLRRE
jgi:inorganic pyrophosphatase